MKELCKQLRPLIGQAKYLGYAAEELALSMKPVSFQEFTEQEHQHACLYDDHTTCNLRATLETFLHEADQMIEEILFPNLLKSFSASDYGCSMNKAEQTLYDLYVSLLQVRSVLLDSQNIHYENLENSTLYQTILKLKNVLCSYTSIVDKIAKFKFKMQNFTTLKIALYIYIFSCEQKTFSKFAVKTFSVK